MRRICSGDGFGSPEPKDRFFGGGLNLKMKDPESIAGKLIVDYNSKAGS